MESPESKESHLTIQYLHPKSPQTHMDRQVIVVAVVGRSDSHRALSIQTRTRLTLLQSHVLPRRSRCQRGLEDVLAVDLLQLNVSLPPPNRVDKRKLHQTAEDEEGAAEEPDLRRLDVTHFRQRLCLTRGQRDERQHSAGAEHDSWRRLIRLQPKRDPRDGDNHHGGDKVVHHVETHFTGQGQVEG